MSACLLLALCSCTSGEGGARSAAGKRSPQAAAKPAFASVTFNHEMGPIGDIMRAFGEQTTGGFVLMGGLEERAIPAVDFKQEAYEEAIAHFAASVDSTFIHTPYYYMVLPPEYEILQSVNVTEHLHERYRQASAGAVFGAKTELYVVFSALSTSLGLTIVADNFIAETRCGEMHLPEAPLGVILEAILQSARIDPTSLVIENTADYLFIRDFKNDNPPSLELPGEMAADARKALLQKAVTLYLPEAPREQGAVVFGAQPIALKDALLPLTEQLGIEVVAHRSLADIPINPCVMNEVSLETALNLLLRQWPLAQFGWELQANRILIRER